MITSLRILAGLAIAALIGCASAGPKMTDTQRHERATVSVDKDITASVSTISDFLAANGYSVDHYDEATHTLTTGWASQMKGTTRQLTGGWDQKVQAKFTPADASTMVEFWLFYRMDGEESLNPYENHYDELMTKLRAYLADHKA